MNIIPAYVFDIDGTLANPTHRLHHITGPNKDWDKFYDECDKDEPVPSILAVAVHLFHNSPTPVIFSTGRSEKIRNKTKEWLSNHNLFTLDKQLYMRKDGDRRPDYILKKGHTKHMRNNGYEPMVVFEDRTQVVKMWREQGFTCLQCADGDF
tara:strand:- start:1192 stop:1647 length:456 start_codon:yes stop_codon:yes gene_type:complete